MRVASTTKRLPEGGLFALTELVISGSPKRHLCSQRSVAVLSDPVRPAVASALNPALRHHFEDSAAASWFNSLECDLARCTQF